LNLNNQIKVKIRKHTLSTILLISVLVVSIFTLFFAASISYKQIQSLNDSEKEVLQSYKVNLELEQLKSNAKEAESSERGYILTRDSTFLQSYQTALNQANNSLNNLKVLTSDPEDSEQQGKNLGTVFYLIHQRFDFLATVLKSDISNAYASDTTKRMMIKGTGLMKLAQAEVDKMIANELQLLRSREASHAKYIKFSPLFILLIVLLALSVFIIAYHKINIDLKSLTKTNNQLLINKEIFEHSEHIANISNWCWNKEDNKLTYSNNLSHLLGCSPDEIESTGNFIEFVHPDDRQFVFQSSQGASNDLMGSVIFYRVIRKDGALRYFKCSWKMITDNYGKTIIIGVNADITEQYNKDKMIEDKIADLEKSNKELSAFNHIASHDLQEPLRKVQTFISRIREKNFETFPENVKDYFSGIERATTRMQMFIEDLLLYSRANNVPKIFEITDLNVILENAKQELSQRIEEKNVIIKLSSYLPSLKVIPFQIQQLFNNLLSNSIKYSKHDIDPVITIESNMVFAKALPFPIGNSKSKYYKISISDNGIGFEQKYADDIFNLFNRLHNNTEYSGTGVGLAICKVIVENHKGVISAEGIPNVGSTVTFYLPF